MAPIRLFTIGFTKKSAERFFTRLQSAGVQKVLDVRLNNNSQLAGFSKRDDLAYFLRSIGGIGYAHSIPLAPTAELLDRYKKVDRDWPAYERDFRALIETRRVETEFAPSDLDGVCLLCSEDKPHHCHRRIVAEYLRDRWGNVEIVHLR
jgi:uncharacterized protein (DUF488 family)